MLTLEEASTEKDYLIASELFTEYVERLGIDISFQNFDQELANLSGMYAKPQGVLIIALENEKPIGCFGIRKLEDSVGELKRMYIREQARGFGIGKKLLLRSIEEATLLGYKKMRLDTLSSMHAAIHLYQQAGFYEIEPYRFNPTQGAKYFEIVLNK
ncbi:MAG: GNAT family N-acetyltransferase [Flammeovirgaceae bacterium]|jgi:GNAT superfamily N-acetyltransferase|nr:GNAT family N-acetyltransferase [Flammeovirgaceae bacterium]